MNITSSTLPDILKFDHDKEISNVSNMIRQALRSPLNKRGLVVAVSGGIDSSVSAALAVEALGKKRIFAILMPEQDSSSQSGERGKLLCEHLGIEYVDKNIASTLEAIGCYEWRDNAIKSVFPDYGDGWKNKIVIDGGLKGQINHFQLVVEDPAGTQSSKRLPLKEYLTIVAATNFKQRIRKNLEYFHADRLNYAVVGTPNKLEYDQGFFVKGGDGLADVKPISHLYKSQVYSLADHMKLPDEICAAVPTTDTYSLQQGQDEFYFALPYQQMDVSLWCLNNNKPASELAEELGLSIEQAEFVYQDIKTKRSTTRYLHAQAIKYGKQEVDQLDDIQYET